MEAVAALIEPLSPGPPDARGFDAKPPTATPLEVFPIDLANALSLGGVSDLHVRIARSRVYEAQADYLAAKANWLPSLRFAVAYNNHAGRLQETEGNVIEVSRNSLFVGGGIGPAGGGPLTAGAGGPPRMFVSWSLADAAFDPLVARQFVGAAGAQSSAALNNALLAISTAYFDLVEAHGVLANARLGEKAVSELAERLGAFRDAGLGAAMESERIQIELANRRREVAESRRRAIASSVSLARLLRLPPQVRLTPIEEVVLPCDFVEAEEPVAALIARGIAKRPELRRFRWLTQAACWRVKQERMRPWLPSLHLGASGGAFGGGTGDDLTNTDGRTDVDMIAVWELQNLGVGKVAAVRQRRSQLHQMHLEMVAVREQIAAEIATAAADALSYRQQTELARRSVLLAEQAYKHDGDLVQQGEAEPRVLLGSIRTLGEAFDAHTHAAADYNRAQYRLLHAIGDTPAAREQPASSAIRRRRASGSGRPR